MSTSKKHQETVMRGVKDLQKLTYRATPVHNTLDDNQLRYRCPLDNGLHTLAPKFSLGDLDLLPLEVLTPVLVQLDLETRTAFRQVNQRAMQIVDSIPEYQIILATAPGALRAVLGLKTGLWISCQLLYNKLCTRKCKHCHKVVVYLYLVTCERVCIVCLSRNKKYVLQLKSHANKRFVPLKDKFEGIPHFRSLPGYYSENVNKCAKSMVLFDHALAKRAGIESCGSKNSMKVRADVRF